MEYGIHHWFSAIRVTITKNTHMHVSFLPSYTNISTGQIPSQGSTWVGMGCAQNSDRVTTALQTAVPTSAPTRERIALPTPSLLHFKSVIFRWANFSSSSSRERKKYWTALVLLFTACWFSDDWCNDGELLRQGARRSPPLSFQWHQLTGQAPYTCTCTPTRTHTLILCLLLVRYHYLTVFNETGTG